MSPFGAFRGDLITENGPKELQGFGLFANAENIDGFLGVERRAELHRREFAARQREGVGERHAEALIAPRLRTWRWCFAVLEAWRQRRHVSGFHRSQASRIASRCKRWRWAEEAKGRSASLDRRSRSRRARPARCRRESRLESESSRLRESTRPLKE